ncbi:hypothetical protein TNCV_4562571, partial [Trichonephila clavipes]
MKTSSVEFISRSPTPSPMERNYRRFVLLRKILSLGSGNEGKREIVSNRRQNSTEENIDAFSLWSPWKYRCGQRTVRLAVVACSQKQRSLARRRIEWKLKLKLLNLWKRNKNIRSSEGERERCAS